MQESIIAKIGYELVFYAFARERLALYSVLDRLAGVAMGNGKLEESILMYPLRQYSPVNRGGAQYHHQIVLYFKDNATIIDIYFFGCVGFRLHLCGDGAEAYGPMEGGISMLSILDVFEPCKPKSKIVIVRNEGESEVRWIDPGNRL